MKAIRRVNQNEAVKISELAFRSKAYWGYSDEFMEACREDLQYSSIELQQNEYYVLCNGDAMLGFYGLARKSDTSFELAALFVEPESIGNGHGWQLIDHAKQSVKTLGGTELVIISDPNATDFYVKAGGVHTGECESPSIPGRYLPMYSIRVG